MSEIKEVLCPDSQVPLSFGAGQVRPLGGSKTLSLIFSHCDFAFLLLSATAAVILIMHQVKVSSQELYILYNNNNKSLIITTD